MANVARALGRNKAIDDALRNHRWEELRSILVELHPSDIADVIIDAPAGDEGIIFRLLPRRLAAQVFAYLPLQHQEGLISSLSGEDLQHVAEQISDDDRTRLFEELPAEVTR